MGKKGVTVLPNTPTTVDEAVLFSFDDVSILYTHNLRLTAHAPQRHPDNPVMRRGAPGAPDEFGVQFYGSIVHDEGRFKIWYVAVPCWRPAYAESADGIHWERPVLGLVEYKGSRANNLVLMEPAPVKSTNLKVLVEPDDPDPVRRYKMVVDPAWWDGEKSGYCTLAPLFSADGLRWRLAIDATPVDGRLPVERVTIPPDHHFEAAGGLYKWRGLYYASGQSAAGVLNSPLSAGEYSGREVVMHRSADFIRWSATTSVGFLREGQYRSFPYSEGEESHEGVSVWQRGNVLLGLYGIWHGAPEWKDRTLDLGFLISNDGVHFREPVTEWAFLPRGDDGAWDQGGLIQGQGFENVGDRTYIWYGAWDLRAERKHTRGGVGLATLERDRFGSLSVRDPAGQGSFVTSLLQVGQEARLWVNADGIAEDASLRVELLDELERPLPAFSGERGGIVQQSGLKSPVLWDGEEQMRGLQDPFKIKVTFAGGNRSALKFYALYVGG